MDAVAAAAARRFKTIDVFASIDPVIVGSTKISNLPSWTLAKIETLSLCLSSTFLQQLPPERPGSFANSRTRNVVPIKCSTRPGIDSSQATNHQDFAVELDPNSKAQHQPTPTPNQALTKTFSRGLVFDLDTAETGSPVVKRYIGDNEERWYMWYHGRYINGDNSDFIGFTVSSNGVHWTKGDENVNSCGDVGSVMSCSNKWWAFDTESIRPSEMVILSSSMYSAVYWLYYTGYSSNSSEVEFAGKSNILLQNPERVPHKDRSDGKFFKSHPGLACSQDGRHWARIEGNYHNGALLDVGQGKDWDSLFIAAPKVVIHSSDDFRMYYHSFDVENGHFAIGMARSRDGIRWVKLGKIMEGSSIRSFDEHGVRNANVVRNHEGGNYLMAYEGVAADGRTSVGLAASPDGLKNWKRLQEEPVLEPLEDDGWDCKGVGSPCLVQLRNDDADEWRLYYEGIGNDGRTGIGMAVSEGINMRKFRRWEGIYS